MISTFIKNQPNVEKTLNSIKNTFIDAKELGSVLNIEKDLYQNLEKSVKDFKEQEMDLIELIDTQLLVERLPQLIKQTKILSNLYDVVCTNPPYMGSRGMNNKLSKYLTEHYPNTKSDLSTVMMEKSLDLAKNTGLISMINIPVWMFLKSYEKLRKDIIDNYTFVNMLHLGRGVFGSDFGTTAFVISKNLISQYKGVY